MNAKLSLKFDKEQIIPFLKRAEAPLVGLALIALFGYTAFVLQGVNKLQPEAPAETAKTIRFDAKTLESLQGRNNVPGQVDPGIIGKSDPFGR